MVEQENISTESNSAGSEPNEGKAPAAAVRRRSSTRKKAADSKDTEVADSPAEEKPSGGTRTRRTRTASRTRSSAQTADTGAEQSASADTAAQETTTASAKATRRTRTAKTMPPEAPADGGAETQDTPAETTAPARTRRSTRRTSQATRATASTEATASEPSRDEPTPVAREVDPAGSGSDDQATVKKTTRTRRRGPVTRPAGPPRPLSAEVEAAIVAAEQNAADKQVETPANGATNSQRVDTQDFLDSLAAAIADDGASDGGDKSGRQPRELEKSPQAKQLGRRRSRELEAGDAEPSQRNDDATDSRVLTDSTEEGVSDGGERERSRRRRRGGRRRSADRERNLQAEDGSTTSAQPADADSVSESSADVTDTAVPASESEAGEATEVRSSRPKPHPVPQAVLTAESSSQERVRRRRRRRRGASGDDGESSDDVTIQIREPRRSSRTEETISDITSIEGSTRMEAKRQRRREGRAAVRRRAPILTEAEFLARRESVDRQLLIRQREEYTELAVLEDKILVEHYVDRPAATSSIGNIYLGRIQNVLPSMEACFIDIGRGRNAVLYAGEVDWDAYGEAGQSRKVEDVFKSGQTIIVQVSKDPVGAKGARLTAHLSIPGRFVVYSPNGHLSGISRKLPEGERGRLRSILADAVQNDASVIVRTAAEGASEAELRHDVQRLERIWADIERKAKQGSAPQQLYTEPDLTMRIIRDLFTEDFSEMVIQGLDGDDDIHTRIMEYLEQVSPMLSHRARKWDGSEDLFHHFRIDEQVAKALERKVFLPSGGSLVIDRTEAMTVIDVNTGKFTGSSGNLEATVTANNLEAAEEIVRQLRLRDIGGIIVIDFIDMVLPSNRELLLRRLVECLSRDRTRHQVAEVTSLGLVQMTRKRIGTGLAEAFTEECPHCGGRGYSRSDHPVDSQAPADGGERISHGKKKSGSDEHSSKKSKKKSKKKDKSASTDPVETGAEVAERDAGAEESMPQTQGLIAEEVPSIDLGAESTVDDSGNSSADSRDDIAEPGHGEDDLADASHEVEANQDLAGEGGSEDEAQAEEVKTSTRRGRARSGSRTGSSREAGRGKTARSAVSAARRRSR